MEGKTNKGLRFWREHLHKIDRSGKVRSPLRLSPEWWEKSQSCKKWGEEHSRSREPYVNCRPHPQVGKMWRVQGRMVQEPREQLKEGETRDGEVGRVLGAGASRPRWYVWILFFVQREATEMCLKQEKEGYHSAAVWRMDCKQAMVTLGRRVRRPLQFSEWETTVPREEMRSG